MHRSDNIRGLIQDLGEVLDERMRNRRKSTPYSDVRPADAKMFMLISRHARSMSDLARALEISRQAAHMSVQRLAARGVVELVAAPGSRRDKIARVTRTGQEVRDTMSGHIMEIERDVANIVGNEALEVLRALLKQLLADPRLRD